MNPKTALTPQALLLGVRRLRWVAVVAIVLRLQFLAVVLERRVVGVASAVAARLPIGPHEPALVSLALFGVALSAGMLALTFVPALAPQRLLALGMLFLVAQALLFALPDYGSSWAHPQVPRGVPLVMAWFLVFPLVPATAARSVFTALAAAAMAPVAAWLAGSLGWPVPAARVVLVYGAPIMSAALFAALLMGLVHRVSTLGRRRRLGSYELVRPIGAGGMGQVWLARHASLSRPAAIKVVQPQLLGRLSARELRDMLDDFEREAQRTALLRSPNTVQLYDFGRTDDGTLFFAMELLGGLDLEALVARHGPQPAGRVISVLRQVCRALAEAHAAGLIHRDVKSANVQLGIYGGRYDHAKVLDFGLALTAAAGRGEAGSRFVRGTPAYVSPEAASVRAAVDARSDLYSLGCVAYELLTGKLPFEELTEAAMVRAHVEHEPAPPSQRTSVAIPPALERLVLSLLEKRPGDRPQTAAEVEARLARLAVAHPWSQADAASWWATQMPEELPRELPEVSPAPRSRATVRLRALRPAH